MFNRSFWTRTACLVALLVMIFGQYPATVAALTKDQKKVLKQGILYYNTDSCTQGAETSITESGDGSPDGATFPNLDPTAMAKGIDTFIQKQNPKSEMKGLGDTIVASANNANVNPFLIVAIAAKESSMSDPNDFNVSHGSNSFGRSAAPGQPSFQGKRDWYKWSSVKASVDYTAPENKNAPGGGDEASYLREQYGKLLNGNDIPGFFLEYAPPSENDTSQYIANVKDWIKQMVKFTGSAPEASNVSSGQTSNTCSCPANGSAKLVGSDNQEKIYNFFVGKGLSPVVSAAFVGNFAQESGWDPKADQPDGPGRGIAQWSEGDRWDSNPNGNVVDFAKDQGGDPEDLAIQLGFVWYELNHSYKPVLSKLKNTNDLTTAIKIISAEYEIAGVPQDQNRLAAAQETLKKFGNGTSGGGTSTGTGCGTEVNCTLAPGAQNGLSATRQNVVCLAQQELSLWKQGKMRPGFRSGSDNSYAKYSENTQEEWCADFASWIYDKAGYPLGSGSNWRVPAVQSVQSIGQENKKFHWHPVGGGSDYKPKPGDLAIYGGSHVNIVTKVSGSRVTVIGGNQEAGAAGYPNGSRVSEYAINGISGGGITGYVSPD